MAGFFRMVKTTLSSDTHESKLHKLEEEIRRLDELVKKKKELNKLKKSLLESEVVTDLDQSDSESEVDSGSEYDPNDEEIESDIEEELEEEHMPVNARKGRPQHCSYCGEAEHKTTTCYDRSWDILVRLRLNKDALRDFVAQM
jgi:hypothetical protein